jgi:hypothetical protein
MHPRSDTPPAGAPRRAAAATLLSLALFAPLLASAIAWAQDDDRPEVLDAVEPDPDEVALEARIESILEEIVDIPAHPWAGEYYVGDGLGMNINLALAPNAGITATWDGCMGRYGWAYGSVQELGDGTVQAQYDHRDDESSLGFPERLMPVAWGPRRYLIDADEAIEFVNAINLGREPRNGMHGRILLARGDEDLAAPGLPTLPSPYLEMIRAQAQDVGVSAARMLEQKRDDIGCRTRFHLTLDRGADIGLVPGTELRQRHPARWDIVHVIDVGATSATAEFTSFEETCVPLDPAPGPGWVFTTGGLDQVAREAADEE